MKNKITSNSYKTSLLKGLKEIYLKLSGEKNQEKIPKTLLNLSNVLLSISPNTFLFKAVEIKEYYVKPDKELDDCFPGNFFVEEDNVFKDKIFEYLSKNLNDYNNNLKIVEGIKGIIDQIPSNSFHKKYDRLINPLIKNMNEEDGTLCRLLVTSPFKYKELTYQVINGLNSSPLPKKASDFYAIKNYSENEKKIKDASKDEIQKLRAEFNNALKFQNEKILEQDKKIKGLETDISQLKKELKHTKNTLFTVQVRDAIKAFIKQIKWSFHIYGKGDILNLIQPILKSITDGKDEDKKEGAKMIINLLENLGKMKSAGNDKGHTIRNEGFNADILPKDIQQKYELYKKAESKCSLFGCDCIALLLSIDEINDSNQIITRKKYRLFEDIFSVPTRDKDNNFPKVESLLLSYKA